MKHRVTFFTLFLSVVLGLLIGVYKYSLMTNVFYYFTFFFVVIFSYRIYLIIEKLGVYLYEAYIKKFIETVKAGKETIEED